MNIHPILFAVATCVLAADARSEAPKMKMTTDIPAAITTPEEVQSRLGILKFQDGIPDEEAARKLSDHLDSQRGVEVFLDAVPGVSTEGDPQGFNSVSRSESSQQPLAASPRNQ